MNFAAEGGRVAAWVLGVGRRVPVRACTSRGRSSWRSSAPKRSEARAHEAPSAMNAPLVVLAAGRSLGGLVLGLAGRGRPPRAVPRAGGRRGRARARRAVRGRPHRRSRSCSRCWRSLARLVLWASGPRRLGGVPRAPAGARRPGSRTRSTSTRCTRGSSGVPGWAVGPASSDACRRPGRRRGRERGRRGRRPGVPRWPRCSSRGSSARTRSRSCSGPRRSLLYLGLRF